MKKLDIDGFGIFWAVCVGLCILGLVLDPLKALILIAWTVAGCGIVAGGEYLFHRTRM
jgi:hypothetical protein